MPNDNNFTPANFDPILKKYDGIPYLRFWCQKVLPAVYDHSLSYYEVLCKLAAFLNKTVDEMEKIENNTNSLFESFKKLQAYVNDILSHYDVNGAVDNKLDEMYSNGQLKTLIEQIIQNDIPQPANDIILIGDSFGQGYTPGVTNAKGWTTWFKEAYKLPGNVYDYSLDGACFLNTGDRNFQNMVNVMANRSDINNNNVGYLIVVGGTNDALRGGGDTLSINIANFFNASRKLFPRAKIMLGYTSNITSYQGITYSDLKLAQLDCLYRYKSANTGTGYLDGIDLVLLQPRVSIVSTDGVHPVQYGYELIGKYVAKYLQSGRNSYNSGYFNIPFRANPTYFNNADDVVLMGVIVDDELYLRLLINGTCKQAIPLDGSTPIGYYDMGSPIRSDIFSIVNKTPISYWFFSGTAIKNLAVFPYFNEGELKLSCYEPSNDGGSFISNQWYARKGDHFAYASGANLWLI